MTNDDKAKAYDEMVQRVKELHETGNFLTKKQMEIICPKLAESEDERVRKEIIHYILYKADGVSEKQEHEWVAYLEKQKEWKHAEQPDGTFTSYDMAKTFMEGQNYVIAHPEKFGLCKPAEWSEEDEINRQIAIGKLEGTEVALEWYIEQRVINWLKSLRPQSH